MANIAADLARQRSRAQGVGTHGNPIKFQDQDFETLRAQCLASDTLFNDPNFPASQSSLGDKQEECTWSRPQENIKNPQFIVHGAEREDIKQGALGDCWFLGAVAALTLNKECLKRVVPEDQSFEKDYAGIFHFKFWQYGEWVEVVVDDRLPEKKGKLMFAKSTTANEFWSALLEKAYAKLNGSYAGLKKGQPIEALEDFTGGVYEQYDCDKAPDNFFQIIQKALSAGSFICCSSRPKEEDQEDISIDGMVSSHTYSLIDAEEVTHQGKTVQLVRVRNPWGHTEWEGAWSDDAPEWNEIDPNVKTRLNVSNADGETWMDFPSFLREFRRLDICHLNPDMISCDGEHSWYLKEFHGSWTDITAGGSLQNPRFWANPHYCITVEESDLKNEASCTFIVGLMQKERRRKKTQEERYFFISYSIFENPTESLVDEEFFKKHKPITKFFFKNCREVSYRFQLPAGKYVIVPSTYNPGEVADFFLRIFTDKKVSAVDPNDDVVINLYEPVSSAAPGTENQYEAEDPVEKTDELNVEELQSVLNMKYADIKFDGFSLRTCRDMINLMDVDNTGTLSGEEFNNLWMKLKNYMKIFLDVDRNFTGAIEADELQIALNKAGFNLDYKIREVIFQRYVSNESIGFEDFIACVMRLETLLKMFQLLDTCKKGNINLSVSEWLYAGMI